VQLVSKISNLCDPDPPTLGLQTDTDRRTTCNLNTALCTIVHRAVKKVYMQLRKWNSGWWTLGGWSVCLSVVWWNVP